jgi:hypothetical protein
VRVPEQHAVKQPQNGDYPSIKYRAVDKNASWGILQRRILVASPKMPDSAASE